MTIATTCLTEAAFKATFTHGMREALMGPEEASAVRSYVDAIPASDIDGLACRSDIAAQVFEDAYGRYHHVLHPLSRDDAYLVVVVDLRLARIYGHHLLDLDGRARCDPR